MCSPQAENFINDVVSEKTAAGELFTAYDVSKVVQSRLSNAGLSFERHNDLKSTIHNAVAAYPGYEKRLQNVGAATDAFVYFPFGSDPSGYVPQQRSVANKVGSNVGNSTPNHASSVAVADTDDGDGLDTGRSTDARGSLTVPAYLLKAAGFNSGEIAYVIPTTRNGVQSLVLSKRNQNGSLSTTYTVNLHTNVRITESVLKEAGFAADQQFDFERDHEQIVVTVH